jgi:chaperonin GroES
VNLQPLHDRIIVRRIDEETNPDLLIVIPDSAKEKSMLAEIVATGPGKDHPREWLAQQEEVTRDTLTITIGQPAIVPMKTKVGDIVLVGKYAGIEFEFDEEDYAIMAETEVLAVLPPKPKD